MSIVIVIYLFQEAVIGIIFDMVQYDFGIEFAVFIKIA